MHNRLFVAVMAALVSGVAVAAQPPVTNLAPVVVTATRSAQPITDTLAPVTVITRADIDRLQPESLPDLLSGQAGIAVANNGGRGQLTTLFMRGTNSNHVVVLVDGVRVSSVTTGFPAWAQLPLDQIERIEIVRGPRSSLYGADAVGGVIQIFTRHGDTDEGLTPAFRISGGSNDTWSALAGLSGGNEHGWFNASLGVDYTHGINSCRMGAGTVFAGCFANEPDDDGNRAYSGLLNGGYRWDNGVSLSANVMRTTGFVEFDGSAFSGNYSRHVQQMEGVHLSVPATDDWTMKFDLARSEDKARNSYRAYDPMVGKTVSMPVNYQNSRMDQASWTNTWLLAPGQMLNLGVDWRQDHVDSTTAYTRNERDNTGVFALYQGQFGRNELQLSARHDDNEQFGGHGTGAIAWGYHFDNGMTLGVSYATAFHAPTFNDLYYPSFPGLPPSANPDLKPEKSRNIEIDLGARHDAWHWQVSAYQNTIDDLIALDANFTPGNIGKARIRGIDAELGGSQAGWTWQTNLTWMQPENHADGPSDGDLLPRRFQRSIRLDLDKRFGDFSMGGTLRAFSHRYDDAANTHRLHGYALLDLRGSWQFAPHWQGELAIDNVFDRDYETVYYYNQPGRTAMLTLRYVP